MDKAIDPQTRDYDGSFLTTLQNAVYLRLTTPRGSYWVDQHFGSLLHLIKREKDLARVGLLAEQYAYEALEPIISDGRAKRIIITSEQPHDGRLLLAIVVTDNRNQQHYFNHHVGVV